MPVLQNGIAIPWFVLTKVNNRVIVTQSLQSVANNSVIVTQPDLLQRQLKMVRWQNRIVSQTRKTIEGGYE